MNKNELTAHFQRLNEIGIALTSERNLDSLLDRIIREAIAFTSAEGGSLFIKEDDHLTFAVTRNETIQTGNSSDETQTLYINSNIPLTKESISGYVAISGEILNIEDAYNIPEEAPYEFDSSFDKQYNYRTRSLLGIPLKEKGEDVIGVLLLVNARDDSGEITRFPENNINLIRSLASQAAVSIQNATLTKQLKDAYLETIFRLSVAAEYKDLHTAVHIQRMSKYSEIIADELGLSEEEQEDILYASPMHDIGKIGVSDNILLKEGKLTDEEYEEMKKHTIIGHDILQGSNSEIMKLSAKIALTHHEKWDGSGYPRGLSGDDIPIEGRIVAAADVFDALTMERPYKDAFSIDKSVNILKEDSGSHFDPNVIDAFLNGLDRILDIKSYYDENDEYDLHPLEKGADISL